MKTITINNTEVQVVEHMKEIKEVCDNAHLFKKWYNRNQMFKALLGNFIFNGETEEDDGEDSEYGLCAGRIVRSDSLCWFIELYKVEDIEKNLFDDLLTWEVNRSQSAFFIEDNAGNLYLVRTDED